MLVKFNNKLYLAEAYYMPEHVWFKFRMCVKFRITILNETLDYDILNIFSIQNFGTISPRGFHRTSLNQSSYNMSLYYINITWTPTLDQFGLNIFCFSAENSYRYYV